MLFTFKRDEEGRESLYVGDVCLARLWEDKEWEFEAVAFPTLESVVMEGQIDDAIDRADEAGFWDKHDDWYRRHEVIVDVPVADNAVQSVTTGEDQS